MSQMIRQAGWRVLGTTSSSASGSQHGLGNVPDPGRDGTRWTGLTIARPSVGEHGRGSRPYRADWGNFVGMMPMNGQMSSSRGKLPRLLRRSSGSSRGLGTSTACAIRDPSVSFDGKWTWNEATQTISILDLCPPRSRRCDVRQARLSGQSTTSYRVRRSLHGPMMLMIGNARLTPGSDQRAS